MKLLRKQLPTRSEIFSVYSVVVFFWYSWGLLVFLYNFPSIILMTSFGEMVGYFSYGMTFIFIDTLLALMFILALTGLLPATFLKKDFAIGGSALGILLFIWSSILQVILRGLAYRPVAVSFLLLVSILFSAALFVFIFRRYPIFRKAILWFGESSRIFVYIYGFFTAIGIIIVLIRNVL